MSTSHVERQKDFATIFNSTPIEHPQHDKQRMSVTIDDRAPADETVPGVRPVTWDTKCPICGVVFEPVFEGSNNHIERRRWAHMLVHLEKKKA